MDITFSIKKRDEVTIYDIRAIDEKFGDICQINIRRQEKQDPEISLNMEQCYVPNEDGMSKEFLYLMQAINRVRLGDMTYLDSILTGDLL